MLAETPAPDFEADRAHYDLSDDFFRCCLDPTMSYSCAYFETGRESLEEAQIAKIERALSALDLKPGERLLEVGHGWGATAKRAVERYKVRLTGLTLSVNHHEYARRRLQGLDGVEFRLEGWETYGEPCDNIVSFGAFEHFTSPKYAAFFAKCRSLLPSGGSLVLQTITRGRPSRSLAFARHSRFMVTQVFPGAEIPKPEDVMRHGNEQGFEIVRVESLRFHYAETLERWAANLERNQEAAVRATNEATYRMFLKYFTSSAAYFRSGEAGAHQFLMRSY